MAKVDSQSINTQQMLAHKLKAKTEVVGKIEEIDLGATDVILFGASKCLNAADSKKLPLVIRPNPTDEYLSSDSEVDEQLMIKLVFRDPVSLSHIVFRASKGPGNNNTKNNKNKNNDDNNDDDNDNDNDTNNKQLKSTSDEKDDDESGPASGSSSGPRMIKLYANKPELDFTDAEDQAPAQTIVLTEEGLKNSEKIPLKSMKFQRCNDIEIFIVDNQNDTEITYLNRIGLIGRLTKLYHTDYSN